MPLHFPLPQEQRVKKSGQACCVLTVDWGANHAGSRLLLVIAVAVAYVTECGSSETSQWQ